MRPCRWQSFQQQSFVASRPRLARPRRWAWSNAGAASMWRPPTT